MKHIGVEPCLISTFLQGWWKWRVISASNSTHSVCDSSNGSFSTTLKWFGCEGILWKMCEFWALFKPKCDRFHVFPILVENPLKCCDFYVYLLQLFCLGHDSGELFPSQIQPIHYRIFQMVPYHYNNRICVSLWHFWAEMWKVWWFCSF